MALLPRRRRGALPFATAAVLAAGALAVLPGAATAASGNLTYTCNYGSVATNVATTVSIDTDTPASWPVATPLGVKTTATLTMPHSVVVALKAIPGFTSVQFKAAADSDGFTESYVDPSGTPTTVVAHPELHAQTADADGNVPFTGVSPAPNNLSNGPSTPGTYTIRAGGIAYEMDVVATTPATYQLTCTGPSNATIDTLAVTAPTTTTVAVAGSTWSYGDAAPGATATVTSPGSKTGWPAVSGSVQFYADGNPAGAAVQVSNGTASLAHLPTLGAGPHAITATFQPSLGSAYQTSTSTASSLTVTVGTSTAVAVSPAAPLAGDPSTATATVTAKDGKAAPGSVSFSVDGASIGSAPLTDGTAEVDLPTDAVGHHAVTASYAGSGPYLSSTSSAASLDVGVPSTTTTLDLDANVVAYGEGVTAFATVDSVHDSPSGTVAFSVGGVVVTAPVLDGEAQADLPSLPVGVYQVRATFMPDSPDAFITSSSAAVALTVTADTTVTTTRVRLTKHRTKPVCTVGVRSDHGMPVSGSVTVTFKRHGKRTVVKTVALGGGTATVRLAKVPRHGRWSIAAAYTGGNSFVASASSLYRGGRAR